MSSKALDGMIDVAMHELALQLGDDARKITRSNVRTIIEAVLHEHIKQVEYMQGIIDGDMPIDEIEDTGNKFGDAKDKSFIVRALERVRSSS